MAKRRSNTSRVIREIEEATRTKDELDVAKSLDNVANETDSWTPGDVSDLLVIMAVLAHKAGMNAVSPDLNILHEIQKFAEEYGQNVTAEEIAHYLRHAQMELLRRQLEGE